MATPSALAAWYGQYGLRSSSRAISTKSASPDATGGKNPIQAVISSVSYLERHTLKAVAGVSEKGEDDDGQGGGMRSDPAG